MDKALIKLQLKHDELRLRQDRIVNVLLGQVDNDTEYNALDDYLNKKKVKPKKTK